MPSRLPDVPDHTIVAGMFVCLKARGPSYEVKLLPQFCPCCGMDLRESVVPTLFPSPEEIEAAKLALLFAVLAALVALTAFFTVVYFVKVGGFASDHCSNCTAVMPSG